MGNPNKDGDAAAESITSPWDVCHTNRDLSWEREAQDAALAKKITKAVAREMAKAHAHYQALLNEKSTAAMPTQEFQSRGGLIIICYLLSLACNVPQSHLWLPETGIEPGSLTPEASTNHCANPTRLVLWKVWSMEECDGSCAYQ